LLLIKIDQDPAAFVETSENFELNNKIIKLIKFYLKKTISIVKDKIYDFYKNNIAYPDPHLKRLIQGMLRKVNGISSDANQNFFGEPVAGAG
jgi:hypothetical protein